MPKKLKNQIPPIVKAALILVAGFLLTSFCPIFFVWAQGQIVRLVFLTFYGPPN